MPRPRFKRRKLVPLRVAPNPPPPTQFHIGQRVQVEWGGCSTGTVVGLNGGIVAATQGAVTVRLDKPDVRGKDGEFQVGFFFFHEYQVTPLRKGRTKTAAREVLSARAE